MKLLPVQPTGTTRSAAFRDFADGSADAVVEDVPTYPPPCREAVRMRRIRLHKAITMGGLARRLGIAVSELSDIERGRLVPGDWAEVFAALGECA